MSKLLYSIVLISLMGCSGLSKTELDLKVANYVLPKNELSKNSVYLISPHGYYEPWTHFNIKVGGQEVELFFGEYKQVITPLSNFVQVNYQYDEVYKRGDKKVDEKWVSISFSNFDENGDLFLLLEDETLIQVDKQTALNEMVTIEYLNQN